MLSLPSSPKTWIRLVLATVGCAADYMDGAAIDQDLPAASRLTLIVLLPLSPNADNTPVAVLKLPEIAIVVVLSKARVKRGYAPTNY